MSSSKSTKSSKSYHHGDLQTALIQSAKQILKEKGSSKLSLREVARNAGVSHAAAYYHFKNKTDLIAAIAVDAFEELNKGSKAAYEQNKATLERAKDLVTNYINFALENPEIFRLMFLPEFRSDKTLTKVEEAGRQGHTFSIQLIQELQEKAIVKQGNPEQISISMWAMMHGLSTLMLDGPLYRNARTKKGKDSLIESSVNHLLEGILE